LEAIEFSCNTLKRPRNATNTRRQPHRNDWAPP